VSRYVKRPRPEPTDEVGLAGLILFGPFYVLWRALRAVWRLFRG
jgi:hypothetical protein